MSNSNNQIKQKETIEIIEIDDTTENSNKPNETTEII